ncbi:MAG: RNA-binding protein [Dehalococcoidales bacterium]|nr:RNA-binding protein [Dehalococcoidales bacterium]
MNIYVGNLPADFTKDELCQEFLPFGEVLSVTIMNNNCASNGQMYGYVEMSSKSEGKTAIGNLTGKMIKGKVIDVIQALPLSNSGFIRGRKISHFSSTSSTRNY